MDTEDLQNEISRLKDENKMLRRLLAITKPVMEFGYTNYRGEHNNRRVSYVNIRYGSTEWHPKPGYLLEAVDLEKQETREFAIRDIDGMKLKAEPLE